MATKTNLHMGKGMVRGDVFPIKRFIKCPTNSYVTKGYLTFKSDLSDADPGVLQKTAEIEDSGSSSQLATLRWDLTNANTLLFTADTNYYFSIKVFFADGSQINVEHGVTSFTAAATGATS